MASTRFSTDTYNTNSRYRKKYNTIVYGSNIRINPKYPVGCLMFVAEMNNDTNKIEGIGLIKNIISPDRHKIYPNDDYNRYVYKGQYWLGREDLQKIDAELVTIFDIILFRGKTHLKRVSGISVLTEKLFLGWKAELKDLLTRVKNAFLKSFKNSKNEIICKEVKKNEKIPKTKKVVIDLDLDKELIDINFDLSSNSNSKC